MSFLYLSAKSLGPKQTKAFTFEVAWKCNHHFTMPLFSTKKMAFRIAFFLDFFWDKLVFIRPNIMNIINILFILWFKVKTAINIL